VLGSLRAPPSSELAQEAQLVGVEEPDVVDAVLEHRHALDAETEREAGDRLGIVADGAEHRRVDQAGAEDLEPPGRLAHTARLTVGVATARAADHAADVDLGARFGEREIMGPKLHRRVGAEKLAHEKFERAFQNLNSLGRTCVVTYYQGMYARLDPFFKNKPVRSEPLRTELGEWRFIWWKSTNHKDTVNSSLCATTEHK